MHNSRMDRAGVNLASANAVAPLSRTDVAAANAEVVVRATDIAAASADLVMANTRCAAANAEIALRAMIPADCGAVAALIRSAFAAQSAVIDPPASALRETEASVAAHLAAGGGAVACAGGQIVGSVMWEPKDGGLYRSASRKRPPGAGRASRGRWWRRPRPRHGSPECRECISGRAWSWPTIAGCLRPAASSRSPVTRTPAMPPRPGWRWRSVWSRLGLPR